MKKLLTIGLLIIGMSVNAQKIIIDSNNYTLKATESAKPGDSQNIGGIVYTVVDKTTLEFMIKAGDDVTKVVTSLITDMSNLFGGSENFNQDISSWDVSNVTNMSYMFGGAKKFNQNISNWDVSSVTNMVSMFGDAESFNQQINAWDVSSVTNMKEMFVNAFSFNSFLGAWDVSSVTNMNSMFGSASTFNQELEQYWDVSKVGDCQFFSIGSKIKTKPKFTKCNPN